MRNLLIKLRALFVLLMITISSAQAATLDEKIDSVFAPFSDFFSNIVFTSIKLNGVNVPILIILLIVASVIFSLYLGGINIWGFGWAIKQLTKNEKNDKNAGEVSPLQALSTALSGTIGLGSIAGVAIAISMGGPGAIFWMFCGAFFGMASKFCECTLALKYRRFNPDGTVSGGPMFYMAHGLTRKGLRGLGQTLAIFFAIMCVPGSLGGGNMLQVNQAVQQFVYMTGGENSFFADKTWLCGLAIAILVGAIVIGGIKSIANVASKIVPLMCGMYVLAVFYIIALNFTQIPNVISLVLTEAFHPTAVTGGVIGSLVVGMRRSIQSNEAGSGSGPIAYAASQTKEAVSQGFVALLEPFFVICICLLTATAILITGAHQNYSDGMTGVQITASAFATAGNIFPYILSLVVILFALSTVISWAYYGQKAWNYLFGEGLKRTRVFQFIFCSFIVIGSCMNLKSVVDFTDATMLAMALPNLIALFILLPEIKKDLIDYCKRFKVKNPL